MPAVAQKLELSNKHNAGYLPRRIHETGDVDIHEMTYGRVGDGDNELIIVNIKFSSLCTLEIPKIPHWMQTTASSLSGGPTLSVRWQPRNGVT